MSQAKSLFDQGELGQAIDELTGEVKSNPSSIGSRTFLFELLSFAGAWDRAERQLDVIGHQSAEASLGVQVYRNNIKAERARRKVFVDGVAPHFLTEPPLYVDTLLEAVKWLSVGHHDEGRKLLDRVEQERPKLSGTVDGYAFKDFRDWDDVTSPVLEVIVQDQYTWLPYEKLKRMEIIAPRNLRDLLWPSAHIEAADGTVGEVFLPALYAGTSDHLDDQVKLGRRSEWKQLSHDVGLAVGSRLFMVDDHELSIFETRVVEFNPGAKQEESDSSVAIDFA